MLLLSAHHGAAAPCHRRGEEAAGTGAGARREDDALCAKADARGRIGGDAGEAEVEAVMPATVGLALLDLPELALDRGLEVLSSCTSLMDGCTSSSRWSRCRPRRRPSHHRRTSSGQAYDHAQPY